MKVGISITSNYDVTDVRAGARYMIDRAAAANDAQLDSLFVGDHHIVPTPYYQNSPILGRLLAEWDNRPCGALYLLPLWNPILVAEQVATLACIAPGPFIMQCAIGRDAAIFDAMGVDVRHRVPAFETALDTVRRLLRGDEVEMPGGAKAFINPAPPQPVDVWIGATAPPAIDRAARLGDVWLAAPGETLEAAKAGMETYQTALTKHGRAAHVIAIRRDVYVADSSRDADAVRAEVASRSYRGFDPSVLMIGEAGEVAAQMRVFGEIGFTDIIVRNLCRDPDAALRSTERLREVKDLLRD